MIPFIKDVHIRYVTIKKVKIVICYIPSIFQNFFFFSFFEFDVLCFVVYVHILHFLGKVKLCSSNDDNTYTIYIVAYYVGNKSIRKYAYVIINL
jgi:hypothetical protein